MPMDKLLSLYKKIREYGLLLFLPIIVYSCIFDDEPVPLKEDGLAGAFLKIRLDLPEMNVPLLDKNKARAMNANAEKSIDMNALHVLVFRSTGEFYYKAPVVGAMVYDEQDDGKAVITVKLVKSDDSSDKFKIGIVANDNLESLILDESVSVEDIKSVLTYSQPGKWNVDVRDYTPFPMWGETDEMVISETMDMPTVRLYRALARIDIGLNFNMIDGKLTEDAHGIPEFKIKEVYVCRTNKSGYIAPLAVDEVHIPSDAERHGDTDPLYYSIENQEGVDSYVREIYVPETQLPSSPSNANMHCVIVGGYYSGSSSVSYYRLDFALENAVGGDRNYLPVIRNHRYVFNINTVRGPGFTTIRDALEAVGTVENIDYDLIEFDESIHYFEVQGKYYFGLDERDLQFIPPSTAIDPTNVFRIKYQTNYPLSRAEPLVLQWGKENPSSLFNAEWDETNKEIMIIALTENVSNTVLFDTLFVKVGRMTIPVRVEQLYVNFKYYINCESVKVVGTYVNGEAMSAGNYIDLSFVAEDRTVQGKTYTLETVDMEGEHGIRFGVSGVFDFTSIPEGAPLVFNVRMYGTGTLRNSISDEPFKLRIVSNSSSGAYCEATIVPVDHEMNILVMSGGDANYGYSIARLDKGAGKVFNNPNNFGPNDNSIVKTGAFNYINATNFNFATATSSNSYKWVTGIGNNGKIADLVYIAYGATFGVSTTMLLMEYLDKGGVIVAFMEDGATASYIARQLLGVSDIGYQSVDGAGVYPLIGNRALFTDEISRQALLYSLVGDPILNGPFGDIREEQIGEDVVAAGALTNVPSHPGVTVYAYNNNLNANPPRINSTAVAGYKYESDDRNLFFWCDGGLMSSGSNGLPNLTGYSLNPFNWDTTTGFPLPMPSYGSNAPYRYTVYNSTMFCNIMAWAVRKSQSLKTKRESYIN